MRKILARIKTRINRDKLYSGVSRFALHTSAIGFTSDFLHAWMGSAMIFSELYERFHDRVVTYSAFAATALIYIDKRRESVKEEAKSVETIQHVEEIQHVENSQPVEVPEEVQ